MKNKLPDETTLNQLLVYSPDDGLLFWRQRPRSMFSSQQAFSSWNARKAGKEALTCINSAGYKSGILLGKAVLAHRVIWKMVTGYDPDEIDHISGDRTNNRFINLRDVSKFDNQKNCKLRADNTSGVPGVAWNKRDQRWVAFGRLRGKRISIGTFVERADAIAARQAWQSSVGFHANHGRNGGHE
ncbi:HNH endonuclease [Neorhizobium sp. S3-V5DH]|uniref:HNH endonuclease n=1 Tax=Neorhizobium sp. S3-V5DH TaxID=2485166 RepID=UPI0010525D23|nr:HNH endonuclease [Neorhizobium sp. S3-V5DH]TCV66301.1 AP2 domain-containing protein [Neorhizobium sp. S3-V5DH]